MLIASLAAAFAVGTVLVAYSFFHRPRVPYLRAWGLAALLQVAALIIIIPLRPFLPDFVSIVFGNTLMLSALSMNLQVVSTYSGRQRPVWILVIFNLLTAAALLIFLRIWPNVPARIGIVSLASALLLATGAYDLTLHNKGKKTGEALLAFFFFCGSLVMLVRAAMYYPFEPMEDSVLLSRQKYAAYFHLCALVFNILFSLGFTLICIDRFQSESDVEKGRADSHLEMFQRHFEMLPVAAIIWRIQGNDYVLERANFAAQVLTEGRIWTQTGGLASQLLARNPEAIAGLNHCRDHLNYFIRDIPTGFGVRDMKTKLSLTFNRISPEFIAVYSEAKPAGEQPGV